MTHLRPRVGDKSQQGGGEGGDSRPHASGNTHVPETSQGGVESAGGATYI